MRIHKKINEVHSFHMSITCGGGRGGEEEGAGGLPPLDADQGSEVPLFYFC